MTSTASSAEPPAPNNTTPNNQPQLSADTASSSSVSGFFGPHYVSIYHDSSPYSINALPLGEEISTGDASESSLSSASSTTTTNQNATSSSDSAAAAAASSSSAIHHLTKASFMCLQKQIIMFGGWDQEQKCPTNHLHIASPDQQHDSLKFSRIHNMKGDVPEPRFSHTCTRLTNTKLLIYGGTDGEKIFNEDVYELDLEDYSWKKLQLKGMPPKPVIGQTVLLWVHEPSDSPSSAPSTDDQSAHEANSHNHHHHHHHHHHQNVSLIMYGGASLDHSQFHDYICELDLKMMRWRRVPVTLPSPCAFAVCVRIDAQLALYGGQHGNPPKIHEKIWMAQVTPRHNVFRTHMTLSPDVMFNLLDFHSSLNTFYNKVLYFDRAAAIKLKDEFIKQLVDKEIDNFFYNETSEEVLNSTVLLKYAHQTLKGFPLFQHQEATQKKSLWGSLFRGKPKERELKRIEDLFFKLPPLFVTFEKTFKSEIVNEMRGFFRGLFSFAIATPWDPKFVDYFTAVEDQMEEVTEEARQNSDDDSDADSVSTASSDQPDAIEAPITYDEEEINFIKCFMNLDSPLQVYNTLRLNKSYDNLPQRYKDAFCLLREKLLDFVKFGEVTKEHVGKLKWLRRVLYIIRPIVSTMNPLTIMNKVMQVLLFSNLGQHGITLTLEVSKTEKQIKAARANIDEKQLAAIDDYIRDKSYVAMDRIRSKYQKQKKGTASSVFMGASTQEEQEKLENELQDQLMKALHLPSSAKKIIFYSPAITSPTTPTKTNEKSSGKSSSSSSGIIKERLPPKVGEEDDKTKSAEAAEEERHRRRFAPILRKDINKNDSALNDALTDEKIGHCMQLFNLETRLLEKKNFLHVMQESNLQQLLRDTLNILMPLFIKMYGNADSGRMVSLIIELLGIQIKTVEKDTKYQNQIRKIRKKAEKKVLKAGGGRVSTPVKRSSLTVGTPSSTPKSPRKSSNDASGSSSPPSPTSMDVESFGELSAPDEEEALEKADDATKKDLNEVEAQEEANEFELPLSELPADARTQIEELEETRKEKWAEGQKVLYDRFEKQFFLYGSEALNKDYKSSKMMHSLCAWISAIVAQMENKTVNMQEIYYTEPNEMIQKQLFLRECIRILFSEYSQ